MSERVLRQTAAEKRDQELAESQGAAITAWLARIIHEASCHAADCPNVQPSEQRLASLIATELKPTSTWYGNGAESQFSTPFLPLPAVSS